MNVEVQRETRGSAVVATVLLQRPDVHNAFNDEVIRELTQIFEQLGNDGDIRVIVLTGAGKSFSAGADLNWMKRMVNYSHDENIADARALGKLFETIDRCPKPTIAKVQGAAIGGGAGLVAATDIAVAAERARFAFSEVRLGIIPAVISPYVIGRIGSGPARHYFLTGQRFDATRAREIGLVSEVTSPESLDDAVDAIISELLLCAPEAVAAAKDLIFAVTEETDRETLSRLTAERIAAQRASSEGQQGMRAFLEKQSPPWVSNPE